MAPQPVALHENLHEELYGLPTPKKCLRAGSEVAPTEIEKTPGGQIVSDSDDEKDAAPEATGETTGTHKDRFISCATAGSPMSHCIRSSSNSPEMHA